MILDLRRAPIGYEFCAERPPKLDRRTAIAAVIGQNETRGKPVQCLNVILGESAALRINSFGYQDVPGLLLGLRCLNRKCLRRKRSTEDRLLKSTLITAEPFLFARAFIAGL